MVAAQAAKQFEEKAVARRDRAVEADLAPQRAGLLLQRVAHSYDIEVQTLAVFDNVRLVLEDAGCRWEDVVDVTVFLTDMTTDFPVFNRLYAEHFRTNQPTRTTVEVGALPTPIAVELKVIALA